MKKSNENLCIYGVSDGASKHKAVRSRVAIMMVVPKQHYHSHNLLLCAQDTLQGQTIKHCKHEARTKEQSKQAVAKCVRVCI